MLSYRDYDLRSVTELVGKTMVNVERIEDDDEIRFHVDDGSVYLMYHEQDCCESVNIEDSVGDLADLVREAFAGRSRRRQTSPPEHVRQRRNRGGKRGGNSPYDSP